MALNEHDIRRITFTYADKSDNPTVVEMRDRLMTVARLVHGEEIAKHIRDAEYNEKHFGRNAFLGTLMIVGGIFGIVVVAALLVMAFKWAFL